MPTADRLPQVFFRKRLFIYFWSQALLLIAFSLELRLESGPSDFSCGFLLLVSVPAIGEFLVLTNPKHQLFFPFVLSDSINMWNIGHWLRIDILFHNGRLETGRGVVFENPALGLVNMILISANGATNHFFVVGTDAS